MHVNCKNCTHRTEYRIVDDDSMLNLCMVEPLEDGMGSVHWLDVDEFDSGDCLYFKAIKKL